MDKPNLLETISARIVERWNIKKEPLVVGINGAQGSGKTMITRELQDCLSNHYDLRVVSFSIDDIYKTKAEREKMAQTVHPLFATRGVPGTHDVALGIRILSALKDPAGKKTVTIPVFDKSIDDRLPESQWQRIQAPVDIILFEGWCVGARGGFKDNYQPINALERAEDPSGEWTRSVNDEFNSSYQEWFALIDYLVMIRVPDFSVVAKNRYLQEILANRGKRSAMSRAEVERFVQFDQRITEYSLGEMPARADLILDWLPGHRFAIDGVEQSVWRRAHEHPALNNGEIHLWKVNLDDVWRDQPEISANLSPEERAIGERFVTAQLTQRYLMAHAVLRELLSKYLKRTANEIRFCEGEHGKPYLAGDHEAALFFNMSHSDEHALFVFSKAGEVGVDIEHLRKNIHDVQIAERYFAPEELNALTKYLDSEQAAAFMRGWTRKEAFIKVTGEGLSGGLDHFVVSLAPHDLDCLISVDADQQAARRWHLMDVCVENKDLFAAVAIDGRFNRIIHYKYA